MNAPELVVWLIPGYLALLIYRYTFPVRTRQGYEWFIQAAGAAIPAYLIARLTLWAGEFIWPPQDVETARRTWHQVFPYPDSFRLLLGILVGVPVGGYVLCLFRKMWEKTKEAIRDTFEPQPIPDLFIHVCRSLHESEVIVTLTNGKVYVGGLAGYTQDIDEPDRFIVIVPTMSGFRDAETHQLIFTTQYLGDAKQKSEVKAQQLLVANSQVVSLGPFDKKLHFRFVNAGTTREATYAQLKAEKMVERAIAEQHKSTVDMNPNKTN